MKSRGYLSIRMSKVSWPFFPKELQPQSIRIIIETRAGKRKESAQDQTILLPLPTSYMFALGPRQRAPAWSSPVYTLVVDHPDVVGCGVLSLKRDTNLCPSLPNQGNGVHVQMFLIKKGGGGCQFTKHLRI